MGYFQPIQKIKRYYLNYSWEIYKEDKEKEIKSLKDEGIETQIIPWFNDNEN